MGKWAARLEEKTAVPPHAGTAKTDTSPLLSVLSVTPKGDARDFQALPVPVIEMAAKPEAEALAADRRARLMRWGWPESEAEALAERLAKRDREGDDRVSCADCWHYRPGQCANHRRAGLQGAVVGRDLAAMLQRCTGFQAEG